ncbi:MAG: hypothetical protein LBQ31_07790 [Bacteroidales bacterium]|jgi:fibronectin type 3 domain-containing protein|nr:hypothetical protein [Bacteroidales bacterium]
MKNLLSLTFIISFLCLDVTAQTSLQHSQRQPKQMIASCDTTGNTVLLKWFGKDVLFKNGVYLYRTNVATKEKKQLNEKPIKRKTYSLKADAFKKDTTLKRYVELLDNNSSNIKEILAVFILLKVLESNDFAKYSGLYFEDTTASEGETYYYEFSQADNPKQCAGISNLITAGKYVIENAPDSLSAKAGDSKVALKWGLDEYRYWAVNIERAEATIPTTIPTTIFTTPTISTSVATSTKPPTPTIPSPTNFVLINPQPILISPVPKQDGTTGLPEKFFEDKTVQNGKTYFYRVVGLDYFNRPTLYSEIVTAQPKDQTPPAPPQNVRSQIGLYDITITWENAFKSNDLAGYRVYRKKGRSKDFEALNTELLPVDENIFYDTVSESGTYCYVVAALDFSNNEARSLETTKELIDIFPPSVPTLYDMISDTGKIYLQWSSVSAKDLLGYRIYRTVTSDKNSHYVLLNATPLRDTFFTDALPRNAKNKFCYKVVSVDSLFNMSDYSNVQCAAMPDVEPPEQPVIKRIIADSGYPLVVWLANAEPDLFHYKLNRFSQEDTVKWEKTILSGENVFRDITAKQGVLYRYVLSAIDSNQNVSVPSKSYAFRSMITISENVAKSKNIIKSKGIARQTKEQTKEQTKKQQPKQQTKKL